MTLTADGGSNAETSMGDGAGGLSDALRRMAEGEDKPRTKREPSQERRPANASQAKGAAKPLPAAPTPPPPAQPAPPRTPKPAPPAPPVAPPKPVKPAKPATPPPPPNKPKAVTPPVPAPAPRATARPASGANDNLKAIAIPIFLTTAVLLMIPAAWALLLLAGFEVWRSDWPVARGMALVMLTCLPISGLLLAGAWFFHRQLQASNDIEPSAPTRRR